jgi:hypothetical protein
VGIFLYGLEKLLDRPYFRGRFVAVPLEVRPFPKDLPGLHIGCFGDWDFANFAWIVPHGTYFNNHYELSGPSHSNIQAIADLLPRSALGEK